MTQDVGERVESCACWILEQRLAKRSVAPPKHLHPCDEQMGYSVQQRVLNLLGASIGAIKAGGTTAATRRAFACEKAYVGALAPHEVIVAGDCTWEDSIRPFAEPELVVGLAHDVEPWQDSLASDKLADEIAWIAAGIECPDSILVDAPAAGLPWLLADRCAAGRLVLGPRALGGRLNEFVAAPCTFAVGDAPVATGSVGGLIGGPLHALSQTLSACRRAGMRFPAGTPMSLGGLSPAVALRLPAKIEARIGGVDGLTVSAVFRGPSG